MATRSLLDRLADVPDPRDRRGRLHPLPAVLGLAVVAMLAGHTTLAAIAQFGRDRGPRLAHALGFRRRQTPCAATLSLLFRRLDVAAFEAVLAAWLADRHAAGWAAVALDGKTLRGSRDGEAPAVHLLAAYAPQAAAVLGQARVAATTNEHKAGLQLLGVLPLAGAVVTADAMFTHRDVAQAILDGGGDYVLPAKDNQETLHADLAAWFEGGAAFSPARAAGCR